ncbi:MAG TPA: hypothetical protein VF271_01935 [Rhodanobacteraceae bacterium]
MKVDIDDPASIAMFFDSASEIDAITCCAASVKSMSLAPFQRRYREALQAKLIGQVDLVYLALRHLRNGGSITLTKTSMYRDNHES